MSPVVLLSDAITAFEVFTTTVGLGFTCLRFDISMHTVVRQLSGIKRIRKTDI